VTQTPDVLDDDEGWNELRLGLILRDHVDAIETPSPLVLVLYIREGFATATKCPSRLLEVV